MSRSGLAVACCAILLSCDFPFAPDFPADELIPFEPPQQYAYWWSLVEACSRRTGSLSAVRWYRTSGRPLVIHGRKYDGYWWEGGNRIAVVDPLRGAVVRHEMLHALLSRGGHPLEAFSAACNGVVAFDGPETYGVTPQMAARAKTVHAESVLVVTIAANPVVPRRTERGGWFTFVLSATNRGRDPVWVALPSEYTGLYVYREGGLIGTAMPTVAKRVFFRPGQRRTVVLDGTIDTVGTVHVRGTYAGKNTYWTAVTLAP